MDWTSAFTLHLIFIIAVLLRGFRSEDEFPTIRLAQGILKGKKVNSSVTDPFYIFVGIPYAKPPVGNLRFKAPIAPEPWNGTFEATEEGDVCPQYNVFENKILGSEDCLFINVFTPQLPGSEPLKPVMVFIHGGGFQVGTGNRESFGADYLVGAGVVFVGFNYRLGVFGFLSTEDSEIPGNAGMKDQVEALRWVKQNIASFGGDPNRVTIFGHSAGAASVHYLMLSPLAKGLYHGAIAESGSAACPWALAEKPRETSFLLGRTLGFSGNSTNQLADFLRSVNYKQLINATVKAIPEKDRYRLYKMIFVPSLEPTSGVEASFLPDTPTNLLDQGQFQNVPFISGVTTAEGIVFITAASIMSDTRKIKEINENFEKVLKPELRFCKENYCGDNMVARIKSFYLGEQDLNVNTMEDFVELCSDLFFVEGVLYGVNKMVSRNTKPIYLYRFTYDGDLAIFKINSGTARNLPGVAHGDELGYLFKTPLSVEEDSTDANVRSRLVTLWTNFAKTGNPTPAASDEIPLWLPYSNSDTNYLDIGSQLIMKKDLDKRHMDFWRELYNQTKDS